MGELCKYAGLWNSKKENITQKWPFQGKTVWPEKIPLSCTLTVSSPLCSKMPSTNLKLFFFFLLDFFFSSLKQPSF